LNYFIIYWQKKTIKTGYYKLFFQKKRSGWACCLLSFTNFFEHQ